MLPGAVVRRAVLGIAAALVFVLPSHAEGEADRVVEKFAREAERAEAKKAEAARKAADEARLKKQAERKAVQARRAFEIRKQAEAQRAKAIGSIQAEKLRAADEEEMLDRARREAEEAKTAAEIRRLIEEAEAARMQAEKVLTQGHGHAPAAAAHEPMRDPGQGSQRLGREADRQSQELAAEGAQIAEQGRLAAMRAVEHRRRLKALARVREVRRVRLALQERRLAQEAEAARLRAEEAARVAFARSAETRQLRARLARVQQLRRERIAAKARRLVEMAEAERARAAERAAEQAQLEEHATRDEAERQIAAAETRSLQNRAPEVQSLPDAPSARTRAQPDTERAMPGQQGRRRVTVLMIMTPGTYGIRRGADIADPVLCVLDGCYISAGADRAARFMPRRRALGFGNTLGGRAGACRRSLSCIFRDVVLDFPGMLQPVDLHIFKHDRRRPQVVAGDSDCVVVAGRLTCNRVIYAEDYVLWIVPERVAAMAGPEVLERALTEGLSASRSAEAQGRSMR